MGKSPGKWIKSVLFGKKSSKSNLPKEVTGEKRSAAKASLEDLALNPPIQNFDRGSENTELEKGTSTVISCDSADLSSVTQDVESQVTKVAISADDAGLKRLEQAATKAQAAFRGYLARQAFLALKGIIKLQALIRGHLVRRQAVATLHCMQAIVRVQALARGQKTRLSDPAHQVLKKYTSGGFKDAKQVDLSIVNKSVRPEKLTASAFVCKVLLTFSPSDETKQKEFLCIISKCPSNPEFLCIISKFPSNPEFLCIISKFPSNPEFLCIISNFYALCSTREENKSLNDRLSTLEKEMK